MPLREFWRGLGGTTAVTAPDSADPRLRGRTYAVPFEQVWRAALYLAGGRLRGWRVVQADDCDGVIYAEAHGLIFRWVDDITIRIALDANAQTRVDAHSASRGGRIGRGGGPRRLAGFFRALDRELARSRSTSAAA